MPSVLIIDDDAGLRAALTGVLEQRDFEVHTSESAETAVDMVKDRDYDFLLVDYKMPNKDGIWFMEQIDLPRTTKALLITAFVNRAVIRRMFELGASGYLIKPFTDEELMKHLDFHS